MEDKQKNTKEYKSIRHVETAFARSGNLKNDNDRIIYMTNSATPVD